MTPEISELRVRLAEGQHAAARLQSEAQAAAADLLRTPDRNTQMRRDARLKDAELAELQVRQMRDRLAAWEALAPQRERLLEQRGSEQPEIDAAWSEMKAGLELVEQGYAKLTALKKRVSGLNGQLRAAGHPGGLQLNLPVDRDWRRRAERLVRDYDRLVHPLM